MNTTKNRGLTQVFRKGRQIGNDIFFKYHTDRTVSYYNKKFEELYLEGYMVALV